MSHIKAQKPHIRLQTFLAIATCRKRNFWKLITIPLIIFLVFYIGLTCATLYCFPRQWQLFFEEIYHYYAKSTGSAPMTAMTFTLGCYTGVVLDRWKEYYRSIPSSDSLAVLLRSGFPFECDQTKSAKLRIMSYTHLALISILTEINPNVKKRYGSYKDIVLNDTELHAEEKAAIMAFRKEKCPEHILPLMWAANSVTYAWENGHIRSEATAARMLEKIDLFRQGCGVLKSYKMISVPTSFLRVVQFIVCAHFTICVLGQKSHFPQEFTPLDDGHHEQVLETMEFDLAVPIFTVVQFIFYVGWLRVAQTFADPLSSIYDDFELVDMLERNKVVSELIVSKISNYYPDAATERQNILEEVCAEKPQVNSH